MAAIRLGHRGATGASHRQARRRRRSLSRAGRSACRRPDNTRGLTAAQKAGNVRLAASQRRARTHALPTLNAVAGGRGLLKDKPVTAPSVVDHRRKLVLLNAAPVILYLRLEAGIGPPVWAGRTARGRRVPPFLVVRAAVSRLWLRSITSGPTSAFTWLRSSPGLAVPCLDSRATYPSGCPCSALFQASATR